VGRSKGNASSPRSVWTLKDPINGICAIAVERVEQYTDAVSASDRVQLAQQSFSRQSSLYWKVDYRQGAHS
jgi:hypothetical protein